MHVTGLLTVLLVSFLFSATASAQVFELGPSAPALFAKVFNFPADDFPGGGDGVLFSPTQFNVANGGSYPRFDIYRAEVNISGGSVGNNFMASNGSNVNLFGGDFVLDGVLLNDLIEGDAFTILDRDVTLSGLLADGSAFSFNLNSESAQGQDEFEPGATLTVTLTPELLLRDCNLDGVLNFSDIAPFISTLSVADYRFQADIDEDGVVSFLDIGPFIELLSL